MGNENSKNKELTRNGTITGKQANGSVKGLSANITSNGLEVAGVSVNGETTVQQNGEPLSLNLTTESTEYIVLESECKPAEAPVVSESPETIVQKEEVKETEVSLPVLDPQPETANLKQEPEPLPEPESVTVDAGPEEEKAPETDNGHSQPAENPEEENPVMNFFKTLVTPKITKKEAATPDATKDQSQKESQPAATTTVAQVSEPPAAPKGMSIPPPPPPEPPKMEIKGEPAAKAVKASPKAEPKAAAKVESPKGKSAKISLSNLFRPKVLIGFKASKDKAASASGAKAPAKTVQTIKDSPPQPAVEVEVPVPAVEVDSAQPVVEIQETPEEVPEPVVVEVQKVDPSKAGTLEAAAKPEPPPPVQEEKKTATKPAFFSLFKPKAADPKKATPAPAAAAETVKAKEEPKAAAKAAEVVVDNKAAAVASQAGDDAANVPKKMEKRDSVQLFFKFLGKRNSTDAGVQTEPVTVAPAAEKAK